MKAKPILIISIAMILLLAGVFFFVRHKSSDKPGTDEIGRFLNGFNNRIKEGNTDSLLAYFDDDKKLKILKRLVNLLEGKTNPDGKGKPIFALSLDIDGSNIKIINSELVIANIPAKFSHDSLAGKSSVLILKIHKIGPHRLKIMQIDMRQFLIDYANYDAFVRGSIVSGKIIFSPLTLQAFETAKQLKTRYDSVIWFAHVDKRTFFYVVKGKWDKDKDMDQDLSRSKDSVIEPYHMGLVNPELKEVIPPEYDLIHNISGTFPGLAEVEKGNKKGFYNLEGKIIIPVNYDQVFPIEDEINLAVLRNGDDYFYLKKDMTISDKVDLKIGDFFSKIKKLKSSFDLNKKEEPVITEYNSRIENASLYIAPSYLVDLNLVGKIRDFDNPLRKNDFESGNKKYLVNFTGNDNETGNWFEAAFYSIRDYFLGGRSEFYDSKNIVILDKKRNRIFAQDIQTDYTPEGGGGSLGGTCDVNSIKIINDSLFEVKAGAILSFELYDTTKYIEGGPYYHYLAIKNNKLVELPDNRNFGFTKYVKMDDSYLIACYNMLVGTGYYDKREKKTLDHVTPEMLAYMKNEIYADYRYQFKDKRWVDVFADAQEDEPDAARPYNARVDDSLTVIDKYNINWINNKLNKSKPNTIAAK